MNDILAKSGRTGADRGVSRLRRRRVSESHAGLERSAIPPQIPDADGSVVGARRRVGLHRAAEGNDRSLRAPAGGFCSRQAAVLRHGDEHRRASRRACWSKVIWDVPTKIEGNPQHPASLGATDTFMQASVLTLYDPDRSQTVTRNGHINTWGNFLTALTDERDVAGLKKGGGFRILTGTVTSPTLAAQIQEFLTAYPEAKWHQYEPCGRHSARAGSMAAFGKPFNTIYRFDRANVVVSLDADFLCSGMPGGSALRARLQRDRRRAAAEDPDATPPRLYVAEATPSITGGMADHRFRMRTADVESFASALQSGNAATPRSRGDLEGPESESRREHRDRRRASAATGPRYRSRAQPDARQYRQDRHLHRPGRGESRR